MNDEQLELDIPETEKEVTEEGLDKVIQAQEERNQRDYEENKYRNRELQRRREDGEQLEIPDMFKAGSTARTLTGLGVEIGGNFLLDIFSFVPGSQQVGSAGLNYLQQVIRGGPISKGEILAAAAASQIPFLQQAKAATRGGKFLRGVAKGSTAGAIDSTVRPIIDEKRAPTVGEFATGVTAGGAFGGMFDLAPTFTKGGAKKVGQEIGEITKDGQKVLGDLTDALTPGPVRIMRGDLLGDTTLGLPRKKAGLKKVVPTTTRDLGLYGATDDMFEDLQTTSLNTALAGGSVRGGRFVKLQNATTGQPEYYTVFTRGGKTQILPYNKWYQKNVNPFMVPKKLLENWRKSEAGQQLNLLDISKKNPFGAPMLDIPYGTKGKTRKVIAQTRYPKGTVDKFNDWYKEVFRLQKEEQKLNRQVSIMLERLGNIEARNPGKKVFDTDLSHIAPRSKGGSGLTFQEAWILNQGRGADDILNPELLAAAGIPRNWDELFNYWLMQQKKGKEFQTAIGPLEHINVDDYFALSQGEALSVVGRRRQNIRNLVERQQGDFETHTYASNINPENDIGDDFEELVRQSKAAQPGGATYMINQNLLDLRYVADNYEDLLDLGEI